MLYSVLLGLVVTAQHPPVLAAAPPMVSMTAPAGVVQWEYTMVETFGINPGPTQDFLGMRSEPTAKALNALGAQGWELVSAIRERDGERVYFVFKRPIPAR